MSPRPFALLLATALFFALGCDQAGATDEASEESGLAGAPIEPPFEVAGDLEGLLLVWFDAEGPHTAATRDEIPEAHREHVRVDDLTAAPDERLDPESVYVADVRTPVEGGSYPVRQAQRSAFDALVDEAQGVQRAGTDVAAADDAVPSPTPTHAATGDEDVVIYGADWCSACRASARFFSQRGVPFVEKNVERDPQARAEMNEKARAAGIRPSGIPVIDFRGTILTGFDQRRLESLMAQGS